MDENEDFRYIDASVSTGSLASSEKSLLTYSSECSSSSMNIYGTSKKNGKFKNGLADIELLKLRAGQSSAAVAVKKVVAPTALISHESIESTFRNRKIFLHFHN